jgi:hypothetical protein
MPAFWQDSNLELWHGEAYHNVLTVQRAEAPDYVLTGHSAVFRLRAATGDVDVMNVDMPLVAPPQLAIVSGVPDTLVAQFSLAIPELTITPLTPGVTYRYAVFMTDSRGETRRQRGGYVYVGKAL